jgi:hypothetical protein
MEPNSYQQDIRGYIKKAQDSNRLMRLALWRAHNRSVSVHRIPFYLQAL